MKDNKKKIQSEYYRGVRKVMEIKLNSVNLLKALNNWAAAVLSYSAPFLDWERLEILEMERKTRNLMTMHK